MGLIAIPFVMGFWRVFHDMPHGGSPNFGMLLALILPLLPIIFLLVVTGFALDIILRDWMLPHFALEDASAGEAWGSVWARIMAEKGQFFAYAMLRLILPTIAAIAIFLILLIPGWCWRERLRAWSWHSFGIREFDRIGICCRHYAAGLLRAGGVWIFPAGEHLPRRTAEHGDTRVRDHLLRRPLPGTGKLAVSAGVCRKDRRPRACRRCERMASRSMR